MTGLWKECGAGLSLYLYASHNYFMVKKVHIIRINKYTGVPKKKTLKKHP